MYTHTHHSYADGLDGSSIEHINADAQDLQKVCKYIFTIKSICKEFAAFVRDISHSS